MKDRGFGKFTITRTTAPRQDRSGGIGAPGGRDQSPASSGEGRSAASSVLRAGRRRRRGRAGALVAAASPPLSVPGEVAAAGSAGWASPAGAGSVAGDASAASAGTLSAAVALWLREHRSARSRPADSDPHTGDRSPPECDRRPARHHVPATCTCRSAASGCPLRGDHCDCRRFRACRVFVRGYAVAARSVLCSYGNCQYLLLPIVVKPSPVARPMGADPRCGIRSSLEGTWPKRTTASHHALS